MSRILRAMKKGIMDSSTPTSLLSWEAVYDCCELMSLFPLELTIYNTNIEIIKGGLRKT
jgi:hypothetical protein